MKLSRSTCLFGIVIILIFAGGCSAEHDRRGLLKRILLIRRQHQSIPTYVVYLNPHNYAEVNLPAYDDYSEGGTAPVTSKHLQDYGASLIDPLRQMYIDRLLQTITGIGPSSRPRDLPPNRLEGRTRQGAAPSTGKNNGKRGAKSGSGCDGVSSCWITSLGQTIASTSGARKTDVGEFGPGKK